MIDINKLNEAIAAMELDSDQLKEIAQSYRQDMVRPERRRGFYPADAECLYRIAIRR